jgi:peptidoglycan/LPS O-acetylase OafA/YrhL
VTCRLTGLDGLRGIAAALVMLHHYSPKNHWVDVLPYGYVAVDFFFILSGFVLDRTYCSRFAQGLSAATFLRARITRLYPAIAVGILIGALAAVLNGKPVGLSAVNLLVGLLFVPIVNGESGIYVLDGVQWSLFFELVVNLAHALILWRLSKRQLAGLAVLGFAATSWATHYFGGFGLGDQGFDFLGGLPRALTGYTIGILLHRLRADRPAQGWQIPWPALAILVTAVIVVLGLIDPAKGVWWIEPLFVFTAFPLILWWGSVAVSGDLSARIAAWIGSLSYPVYAIHLPVLNLFRYLPLPFGIRATLAVGLTFAGALALLHFFEARRRSIEPKS